MDPEETLAELRRIAATYDEPSIEDRDAYRMAELFRGMDEWLSKGGFLPRAWGHWWQRGVTMPISHQLEEIRLRVKRLRNALKEAGVAENLVRAVELGGEEPRADVRTEAEVRNR